MAWETGGPVPRRLSISIDGLRLEAVDVKGVMRAYREAVARAGGMLRPGWEGEVWSALAESHPRYVRKIPGPGPPTASLATAKSFVNFMLKRLTNRSLVSEEEARRRAEVCFICPLAQPILGCSSCKDVLALTVVPPVRVEAPEACGACGCYLPLKIWIPRAQLGDASAFPFDSVCWMREP